MSDLVLWDYYIEEELRFGPSYDMEYAEIDLTLQDEGNLDPRETNKTLTKGSFWQKIKFISDIKFQLLYTYIWTTLHKIIFLKDNIEGT